MVAREARIDLLPQSRGAANPVVVRVAGRLKTADELNKSVEAAAEAKPPENKPG